MIHKYHSQRHGKVELTTLDKVMVCRPIGAFNLDGVIFYEKIFEQKVSNFKYKKWALLNQYQDFEICGPEVTKRLRNQLIWCQAQGCQVIGFATFNSVQEYFVRQVTKDIPFKHILVFNDQQTTEFQVTELLKKLSDED